MNHSGSFGAEAQQRASSRPPSDAGNTPSNFDSSDDDLDYGWRGPPASAVGAAAAASGDNSLHYRSDGAAAGHVPPVSDQKRTGVEVADEPKGEAAGEDTREQKPREDRPSGSARVGGGYAQGGGVKRRVAAPASSRSGDRANNAVVDLYDDDASSSSAFSAPCSDSEESDSTDEDRRSRKRKKAGGAYGSSGGFDDTMDTKAARDMQAARDLSVSIGRRQVDLREMGGVFNSGGHTLPKASNQGGEKKGRNRKVAAYAPPLGDSYAASSVINNPKPRHMANRGKGGKSKNGGDSPSVPIGEVGYTFRKHFPGYGIYEGTVKRIRLGAEGGKDRRCVYKKDGDREDLSLSELRTLALKYPPRPTKKGTNIDAKKSAAPIASIDAPPSDQVGNSTFAIASQVEVVDISSSSGNESEEGNDDEDRDLKQAIVESQKLAAASQTPDDEEQQLRKVLKESRIQVTDSCDFEEFMQFVAMAEKVYGRTIEDIESKSLVRGANGEHMYGRVLFEATEQLFNHLQLQRHDIFIDIGAGAGLPTIQAALTKGCTSRGIEIDEGRHAFSKALNSGIHDQIAQTERKHNTEMRKGDIELRLGDLRDPENRDFITEANVALVNNAHGIFSTRSVASGRDHKQPLLDDHVGALFAMMKPESRMVTFYPLLCLGESLSEANKKRKRLQKSPHCNASFFEARTVHLPPKSFSWSTSDDEIQVFIYERIQNIVGGDYAGAYFVCGDPKCPHPDTETSAIDDETMMLRHACVYCEVTRKSSGSRTNRKLTD